MPLISLTDFVDIVARAGSPKATKVRQVKQRPEYEPAFDFYKILREHVIEVHRKGEAKSVLSEVLTTLTDQKKIRNYPDLLSSYKKWWGRKNISWFSPPRDIYSSAGVEIMVNPELGLVINDKRHVIKLYFKNEALSKFKAELIVDLLEHQLRQSVQPGDTFGVLDIRAGKLFSDGPHTPTTMPMVNAEIAYIASLWNQ